MLSFGILLILVPLTKSLACPNYVDYTGNTVQCSATCPPGTKLYNNKCLS